VRVGDVSVSYDGMNPQVQLRGDDGRFLWLRSPEEVLAMAVVLQRYGEQMVAVEAECRKRSR
jgi:hypothetical protein